MCSDAKIANTDTITIAALVTVPAERTMPAAIASRVDNPSFIASRTWFSTKTW